jgi:glutathione S-transferase
MAPANSCRCRTTPTCSAGPSTIAARPAVQRGRKVNRATGDLAEQLPERHDASDFDTRTQDAHLADRDFIATDRFSIADITAVVAVDFARVIKVRVTEAHPHLMRWRAAMAERPSMSL